MSNEASPSTRADVKLETLANVEKVVNQYAAVVAQRHRIPKEHFEVILSTKLDARFKVIGGSVVKIIVRWPEVQPEINTVLGDCFKLMRKYPIRRTMEVVPVAYIRTMRQEIKKQWKKEKFTDESDIVLDLLPRYRLRVKKIETTIIEDAITGESLTLQHSYPTERFEGDTLGLWMQLSRIVRDRHPEEELPDVEPKSPEAMNDR